MASWTNVVGRAGKSAAIAGLEKLQQGHDSSCDDGTAYLNSSQDVPVGNQRFTSYDYVYEEQELRINEVANNELENEVGLLEPGLLEPGLLEPGLLEPGLLETGLLEPGKEEHGSSLLSFKSFPTTSESFSYEENAEEESQEDGVGFTDPGLVEETVERTNESSMRSLGGDGDLNVSQVTCPCQDDIKLELQPEKCRSLSERSDKTDQCEFVCRRRHYVTSKEIKIPAVRLANTIPTKSWIAFPFKILPARFAAHAAVILFLYSWIICAIMAYKVLHFSYVGVHGSDWEKFIFFLWDLRRLVLQPTDEDMDTTPLQKEKVPTPTTTDNVLHDAGLWHW